MDVGGREILLALGALLLLAILLDGVRRMRDRSGGKLRVRKRKQPIFDDDEYLDETVGELPSGRARVVATRDQQSAEQLNRAIKENIAKNGSKLTAPFRDPEQGAFELEDIPEQRADTAPTGPRGDSQVSGERFASAPQEELPDVIVIHAMAGPDQQFDGGALRDVALANNLRYGSQKIFHRHDDADGAGNVLFSMANTVNPGTFELDAMDDFATPGVTFMMILQDNDDPMAAFELMLETVYAVNAALGGELKDEQRSALTRQTAEHYRQRIMDFNRRRLAAS